MMMLALFLFSALVAGSTNLTVRTRTGIFTGLLNPEYPSVREFRAIPYAQPPVASRRWLPPATLPSSNKAHYATNFPPSCPQYVSSNPTVFSNIVPEFFIWDGNENTTAGLMAQASSEDCLQLAIWAPSNANTSNLPVLLFMTGGGFKTGGINVPYQLPASWVSRTQSHIVVTINYRVNIMGFPNAAGLDDQNLGILDQRAALEWVHENIHHFGGDPTAITLWGQSAGSISTDFHTYAWHDNLIARATFSQSGTAIKPLDNADHAHTNFTFVAKHMGCDFPTNPAAELDCMRQVSVNRIENFVGQYSDSKTTPSLVFTPIADEKIVFSDYPARAANGLIANTPAIMSNCANEAAALYTYPSTNVTAGPWQPGVNAATLNDWLCVTAHTSIVRHNAGRKTYRYQYAGNFTNLSPFHWMGAYHSSDLAMNFGTYSDFRGEGMELEKETSEVMQDYLLAFARDPERGLEGKGWEVFNPYAGDGGLVKRFGADGRAEQNVSGVEVQGACWGEETYDAFP
ncbi:carboxylesterase [Aspergillus sclerotioniger CBS 115572]|uniref:Carboxylic ester hydrolase n=1 Tax=Aspergillus sclerotioniger CBS 115572 TaxID=1450535 RepID=A0A317VNU8_9EURO|nr:carboxylesterase [Aspergillus sclerotioniger CBS 115572]PWY75269.1 carboxylesterase [Aspergillus sclerotioniger CBS 115572]